MNGFLKKNLDAIRDNHLEIKLNEELISKYNSQIEIEPITSYKGYSLCSAIDQEEAIRVWCEQFKELKHNEVVFVFGIGSLDYYVRLREMYPDLMLVIYEPSEEIFYNNLSIKDYTSLLLQENITICIGEKIHQTFAEECGRYMGYESIYNHFFALIPNYNKIFEEEYDLYIDKVDKVLKNNAMSRVTAINFEEEILDNYLDNLRCIPDESTMIELIEQFYNSSVGNYPAIILAAGPSLDKNIHKLKDVKGRALIIAVDAAVNTAIANNIRPDMIVSDDPHIKVVAAEDSPQSVIRRELPLVIRLQGSASIRDACRGRKFYTSVVDYYIGGVLEGFGKIMPVVQSGGSVANTAYSVARMLGCSAIILMGQDLGFPDNKQHAKDAFEGEEDASEEDSSNFYVDSIDGGKVLTSEQMDIYRAWFESMIRTDPDYEVIDATEGGALIHGSIIMTIDEAIDKYCPREKVDFEEIINNAPYLVEGDDKEELRHVINKTFTDIDSNIRYIENAKRDYYKLRDINEKKRYNSKEFKRLIEKVGEHNQYIENNKDFALYRDCCAQKHYEFVDALKQVYDDEYDNIKNLVDQSLIMLDEYIRAGKILKEKWKTING